MKIPKCKDNQNPEGIPRFAEKKNFCKKWRIKEKSDYFCRVVHVEAHDGRKTCGTLF